MANKFLFLRAVNSPFVGNAADITKNSVLSHSDVDNNFIFLKGEDILTGSTVGSDLILNKVNSDNISIDLSSISGGGSGGAIPANTFKANITGSSAVPTNVSRTDLTNSLPYPADSLVGFTAAGSLVRFTADKLLNTMTSQEAGTSLVSVDVNSMQIKAITTLGINTTIDIPGGSPTNGMSLTYRLKDNGTPRTLAWDAVFRGVNGATLPTTTLGTTSDLLIIKCLYNAADTKWDVYFVGGGGGTSTLNNGDIFVGNASNVATSVTMTGDTLISNTGVVTIQPDSVSYDKMQDTTQAALLGNTTGSGTVAEIPIIEQYISNSGTVAGYLNNTAYWDINGNYLGTSPSITGTYQGQSHYNGDYWFTAVADNVWIRLIRG